MTSSSWKLHHYRGKTTAYSMSDALSYQWVCLTFKHEIMSQLYQKSE